MKAPETTLTDGSPVTPDHRELKPNCQQKAYVVLSDQERAKGFIRPVRTSYRHVGAKGPQYPLRDLREDEKENYAECGYVKWEQYPEEESPLMGRYWTQAQLEEMKPACGGVTTTMGLALAETYARDPKFYGGTFCVGCGKHYPVDQFVWSGTNEQVGS